MNELAIHMRLLVRVFMLWIAGCLLVWAFFPSVKPFIAGLILGCSTSLLNSLMLSRKIEQLTRYVIEQGKRVSLGTISRYALALIAVMTAIRFEQFDVMATMIGFFFAPVVTFFIGIFLMKRNQV